MNYPSRRRSQRLRPETKLDDLPLLPFEKIFSYLSLVERIRLRGVSKRWQTLIGCFTVKKLFYSPFPRGCVFRKNQIASGAFAQYFICSCKFVEIFYTFGQPMFLRLRHLRLYKFSFSPEIIPHFVRIIGSLGLLEQLDLIEFSCLNSSGIEFQLNLPNLISLLICITGGIEKLTLDAPKLEKIKLQDCKLTISLVHVENVKRLLIEHFGQIKVHELKNLTHLTIVSRSEIDSTLLADLEQLNEIHLQNYAHIPNLFDQKQRFVRTGLKIYFFWLLKSPNDPSLNQFRDAGQIRFSLLARNFTRLADELPRFNLLRYYAIEEVSVEASINIANRFTDLSSIIVSRQIQDVQRFLNFLSSFPNIMSIRFFSNLPQNLFDRLPDHCAVQILEIRHQIEDLQFLFELRHHLIILKLDWQIDAAFVRRAFEELRFLTQLRFNFQQSVGATICHHYESESYRVLIRTLDRLGRPLVQIVDQLFSDLDSMLPSLFGLH